MKAGRIILSATILMLCPELSISTAVDLNRTEELKSHVSYLASDRLEGREPCSRGDTLAREYIAGRFREVGLLPVTGGSYFQPFPVLESIEADEGARFSQIGDNGEKVLYRYGEDFVAGSRSGSGAASGEGVFIGYGINSPESGYRDFDAISLKGRIVFCFLFPDRDKVTERVRELAFSVPYYRKLEIASSLGASAFVFIYPEKGSRLTGVNAKSGNRTPNQSMTQSDIPVIRIEYRVFQELLKDCNINLEDVEESLRSSEISRAFVLPGRSFHISCSVRYNYNKTCNVIGLSGNGKTGKPTILIGAHYDHYGYNRTGTPLRGANDNASGVAVMIELASLLSGMDTPGCNYLFVAFGMEESGCIGSRYFIRNIPDGTGNFKAMINIDMVGGMTGDTLMVWHSRSAKEWPEYLAASGTAGIDIVELGNSSPSDSDLFCRAGIPTLSLYTGPDSFDHRREIELLNYPGMNRILNYTFRLIEMISLPDNDLTFTGWGPFMGTGSSSSHKGREGGDK